MSAAYFHSTTSCLPLSRLVEQAHAKLQQYFAAPPPSANGDEELNTQHATNDAQFTGGAATHGADPLVDEPSVEVLQEYINGIDWNAMENGAELGAELRTVMDETFVAALAVPIASSNEAQHSRERPSSSDGDDNAPPPTSRQRTEEPATVPAVDPATYFADDPNVYRGGLGASAEGDAPPALRGLSAGEDQPRYQSVRAVEDAPQLRSLGASAPLAFRSLGPDEEIDEPVLRSAASAPPAAAAAPTAVGVAPSPRSRAAPLAPSLRAAATTKLVAIAREMLRLRREKGGAAAAAGAAAGAAAAGTAAAGAAGVSSMAAELEDLRQWIRFHRG